MSVLRLDESVLPDGRYRFLREFASTWRKLMIPGVELVAGYLAAWGMSKAKRIGSGADREADRAIDAGMARLHDLVTDRLGADPSLARLEKEAAAGAVQERTIRRTQDAVEQSAEDDPDFAKQLQTILGELTGADGQTQIVRGTGAVTQTNVAGPAVANTGNVGGDVRT